MPFRLLAHTSYAQAAITINKQLPPLTHQPNRPIPSLRRRPRVVGVGHDAHRHQFANAVGARVDESGLHQRLQCQFEAQRLEHLEQGFRAGSAFTRETFVQPLAR